MSLARTLMNGGSFGTSIDPSKYTHDMGATRIAMESVEELHEIFIESFYNVEQAELAAATEGVELIGSEYEVVAEGAIKDAFTKIKEFLKKLWDKVKAWFHQVKRFFDSLLLNGKEFVKRYKKDIETADKTLKDFSYTMYDYNDAAIDDIDKDIDVDAGGVAIFAAMGDAVNKAGDLEAFKKYIDEDNLAKELAKDSLKGSKGPKVTGSDDFDEAFFAFYRNGATSKEDKEEIDISDLGHYASILTNAKSLSALDSMSTKIDKTYKRALKLADELEKEMKDLKKLIDDDKNSDDQTKKDASDAVKIAQTMSTGISRQQSLTNRVMNIWKTAYKERDTVYKQLIVAGLSNARKNAKKK